VAAAGAVCGPAAGAAQPRAARRPAALAAACLPRRCGKPVPSLLESPGTAPCGVTEISAWQCRVPCGAAESVAIFRCCRNTIDSSHDRSSEQGVSWRRCWTEVAGCCLSALAGCRQALVWPWAPAAVRAEAVPALTDGAHLLAHLNEALTRTALLVQPLRLGPGVRAAGWSPAGRAQASYCKACLYAFLSFSPFIELPCSMFWHTVLPRLSCQL
jgi:hypothetical protein